MATPVRVDVTEPGRAVIVGGGHQARVGRCDDNPRLFYVEDTDSEEPIGHARTYRDAGKVFAVYHSLDQPDITVDHEKG